MAPSQFEGPVCISSIALHVRPQFGETVDHIAFQTISGSFYEECSVQLLPGNGHERVFGPALNLSAQDQLSVSVRSQPSSGVKLTYSITVELSEVVNRAQGDGNGMQTYVTCHKDIEVAIVISASRVQITPLPITIVYPQAYPAPSITESSQDPWLTPITEYHVPLPITGTDEIRKICPRFRLLIIGNTGVGKATLIRKVFGVQDVDISENLRGKADINSEFVSEENPFFVLHDSVGLEAGDSKNFDTIKNFISARRREDDLKDRLHAVWVCLSVPFAKGRLLEAGMEEFLRDRKTILGDIPVVVVLTKLDLLDNSLTMALRKEGVTFKTMEEAQPHLEPRRTKYIEEFCGKPLQRATGGDIPHVAVSTRNGYKLEPTISELAKATTSEIERYIRANLPYSAVGEQSSIEQSAQLYMAVIALGRRIEEKVDLTIALGKQKYWTSVRSYKGRSPDKEKKYLLAIHRDIIRVWNFNDPTEALQSIQFKEALLDTSDLEVENNRDILKLDSADPSVAALTPLINDLIGGFLTLPLTGANYLRRFILEAERSSKCFMAYIVDLVYVMRILFILAPQGAIASQDVALAVEVYRRPTYRNRVHMEIRDFSVTFPIFPGARDAVVDKMETLIKRYDITDKEVERVRSQIRRPKRDD